jgi:UDP-glucose 4-epimerase
MTTASSPKRVLVTGGTGYIGSHLCVALIEQGIEPVIVDNLSNSNLVPLDRIASITGFCPVFYEADVRDASAVQRILREHQFDAVIHFAGLKAVGESVQKPLEYYRNNVEGTLRLCEALDGAGVRQLIFSSSATIYGVPDRLPIPETASIRPTNPYGQTKAVTEQMLADLHTANPGWRIGILRYFNPVGAHESGLIGEDPVGIPSNLIPYIAQVAIGQLPQLQVFGNDYPTRDGTGVRDYIHVVDLARGHLAALDTLMKSNGHYANGGILIANLGTGQGYSVLEVVRTFGEASGRKVPYEIVARRPGDIAECYADPSRAAKLLGWQAERGLEQMCQDAWRWQMKNTDRYRKRH